MCLFQCLLAFLTTSIPKYNLLDIPQDYISTTEVSCIVATTRRNSLLQQRQLPTINIAVINPPPPVLQRLGAVFQQCALHPDAVRDNGDAFVRLTHEPDEKIAYPPRDVAARLARVRPPVDVVLREEGVVGDGREFAFQLG